MTLRERLSALAALIADRAERDPAFAAALDTLFAPAPDSKARPASPRRAQPRRAPAVLDPVAVAREGEAALRARLAALDLEALRDIVAAHGMDPNRKVMKWRTTSRVVDEIVALALGRARKGDVFRAA